MAECIFCAIARGEVPANSVYRDDEIIAIEDVNPQAPVHLLVMPVAHRATISELVSEKNTLALRLMELAASLGRERGGETGFRLVVNTGRYAGQTVDHVHVHVLAGRPMSWPPG
jgi:histidine triad (HIT) family protein